MEKTSGMNKEALPIIPLLGGALAAGKGLLAGIGGGSALVGALNAATYGPMLWEYGGQAKDWLMKPKVPPGGTPGVGAMPKFNPQNATISSPSRFGQHGFLHAAEAKEASVLSNYDPSRLKEFEGRALAFKVGVDLFCKEAGFDADDRRAMYGLIKRAIASGAMDISTDAGVNQWFDLQRAEAARRMEADRTRKRVMEESRPGAFSQFFSALKGDAGPKPLRPEEIEFTSGGRTNIIRSPAAAAASAAQNRVQTPGGEHQLSTKDQTNWLNELEKARREALSKPSFLVNTIGELGKRYEDGKVDPIQLMGQIRASNPRLLGAMSNKRIIDMIMSDPVTAAVIDQEMPSLRNFNPEENPAKAQQPGVPQVPVAGNAPTPPPPAPPPMTPPGTPGMTPPAQPPAPQVPDLQREARQAVALSLGNKYQNVKPAPMVGGGIGFTFGARRPGQGASQVQQEGLREAYIGLPPGARAPSTNKPVTDLSAPPPPSEMPAPPPPTPTMPPPQPGGNMVRLHMPAPGGGTVEQNLPRSGSQVAQAPAPPPAPPPMPEASAPKSRAVANISRPDLGKPGEKATL